MQSRTRLAAALCLALVGCADDTIFGGAGSGGAAAMGGAGGGSPSTATIKFAHFDADLGMVQINDPDLSTAVTFVSGFGEISGPVVRGEGERSFEIRDPASSQVFLTTPRYPFVANRNYVVLLVDDGTQTGSQVAVADLTEPLAVAGDGAFVVFHAEETEFDEIDVDIPAEGLSIARSLPLGQASEAFGLAPDCYLVRVDTDLNSSDPEDSFFFAADIVAGRESVAVVTANPLPTVYDLTFDAVGALPNFAGSCP